MSLGGETPTRDLRAAVGYAIAHGVVVVSAAGNSGTSPNETVKYELPTPFMNRTGPDRANGMFCAPGTWVAQR